MSEVRSLQRFHSLSAEQVEVLDQVLSEVVPIHGRGNFPTLELRPRDIIAAVRSRLQSQGIVVRDVRLNGSTASHVLVRDNGTNYKDLDIIFGVDLPRQEDFQVIKESVLACLLDCLPVGVNKERISSSTMKEAYVQKMVKVFTEQDRWSLISLSNNSGKNLELKFVSTLRRQFEFSVDSFQIILDRMLESYLQAEESQQAANMLGLECCGLANHSKKALPPPAPASSVDILVNSETEGSSDKRTVSDEMAQLDSTENLYKTKSSDHEADSDKKTLSDEKDLAELPLQMASAEQSELSDQTEQTGNCEEAHHYDETDSPDTKETSDQEDASDTTEHTGPIKHFKPEQTGHSDCVKLSEPTGHLELTKDSDPTKQSDWTEPSVRTEPTHGVEHSDKTGSNKSFSKSEIPINSGTQTKKKDKYREPEKPEEIDKKTEIQQDTDTPSKSMTDYIPAIDTGLSVSLISYTPSDDNTQATEAQHTLKTQNTEHTQDSNPMSNTALQDSENTVNTVNTADTQVMPQAEPSRMADRNSPSPPPSKAPTRLSLMVVLKHSSPKPPRRMCRKVSPIPYSAPDPDLTLTLGQRIVSRPEDNEETGPGTEASSGPMIAHSSKYVKAPYAEPNIDPSPESDLEPIVASSPAAYKEHMVPHIPKPNLRPFIAPIQEINRELFLAPIQEPGLESIIDSGPETNPEPIIPPIPEPKSDLLASSSEPGTEPIITNSLEPTTPPIPEFKPEQMLDSILEPTPVSIIPLIPEPKPEPTIPSIPEPKPEPILPSIPELNSEPIIVPSAEHNTDLIIAPSPVLEPAPIINLSPVTAPEPFIVPSPKHKPALIIALPSPDPEMFLSTATSTEDTTSSSAGSRLEPVRVSGPETRLETQTISGPDPIPESETLPTTQPEIIPSHIIVSSAGCNQTESRTTPTNADHVPTCISPPLTSSISISANPDTAPELESDSPTNAWSTPPREQPGSLFLTETEVGGPAPTDSPYSDETSAKAPEDPGSPQREPKLSNSPDQLVPRPRTLALHSHTLSPRSEAELTEGDRQTDQHTVEQCLSTQHRSPAISGLAPPTLSISPRPLCFPRSMSLSPPLSYSPPPLSFSPPSSCLSSPPYLTPPMLSLSPPPCHSPPSPCLTPPLLCLTPPVESEQSVAQVYLDSEPLIQNTVIGDQVAELCLQLPVPHLRNKELPLSPLAGQMAQSPASEPIPLSQLRQNHVSAPPEDSKPINPAPESRESPRVTVDTSEQSKAPTQTSSRVPTVEVLAESMYGDFEAAMDHLRYRLIATRNPEEIRGGGLLKYSNLLVRDYRPASETQIKTLERYMCSRFFIDFPDVQEQQRKILSYLKNHFIGEERSKYQYLMTLRRVVDDSTVCLMGHERRQTLNMITVLALRVLGEQNIIPNTDHVTCYYQPAPYLAEHSAPFMAEASYCSYYIPQGGSTLLYQPYPLHLHTQTGLV